MADHHFNRKTEADIRDTDYAIFVIRNSNSRFILEISNLFTGESIEIIMNKEQIQELKERLVEALKE